MRIAYVLIHTVASMEHVVYGELKKMSGSPSIDEIHILFGDFDILIKISGPDYETVQQFVKEKVRTIQGIIDTKTLTGAH